MKLKRVLITGAAGFIGRHLAKQYSEQGWQVLGSGHGSWNKSEQQAWGVQDWHTMDITLENLQLLGLQPDVIMHCAGSSSVGYSLQHPYQDFQRNVDSTAAVLEYIRLNSLHTRLVYLSSAAVYGVANLMPIAEASVTNPVSAYGMHKLMAELLCRSYAREFGMPAVVVRLFSVYGAGLRKQLLWDAGRKIAKGRHEYFGTGEETRDWLHVQDAVALLMRAADHAEPGCPIINGGSGSSVRIKEILQALYAALQVDAKPHFSGQTKAGDPVHYCADTRQAAAWGWQPSMDWRKGVQEYAAWLSAGAP